MENCNEKIKRYLLGAMDEKEESEFQLHLLQSPECRKKLERARRVRAVIIQGESQSIQFNNKRRYKLYYAVAAVIMLLLVSGFVIYQIDQSNQVSETNVSIAKAKSSVNIANTKEMKSFDCDTVDTEVRVTKPKEIIRGSHESNNENSSSVSPVIQGKKAPSVARAVVVSGGASSEASKSYTLPNEELAFGTIISPNSLDTNYEIQSDSMFVFKWNTYYNTPFFFYIKADDGTLENFHGSGDSFTIDMRRYKENEILEWSVKIMGDDGAIKNKGVMRLK